MAEALANIISRQVQGLYQRLRGIAGSTDSISPPEGDVADSQPLSDNVIISMLEGDSQWSNEFQDRLGRDFEQVADRALDYWMRTTDRGIRGSVGELTQLLGAVLTRGIDGRGVANLAGGFAESFVTDLLTVERTTVQETDRSVNAAQQYRVSRGQVQADLARQLSRGQRFL